MWWFRRRVPDGLTKALGRGEFHRSLATGSRRVASVRASALFLLTERLFDVARTPHKPLAARQAEVMLRALAEENPWDSPTFQEVAAAIRAGDSRAYGDLAEHGLEALRGLDPAAQEQVLGQMDRLAEIHEGSALRADPEAARADARLSKLKFALAEASDAQRVHGERQAEAAAKRELGPPFSTHVEDFVARKRLDDGWDDKTIHQSKATFDLWRDLMGDTPVQSVTVKVADGFLVLLRRLPAGYGKDVRSAVRKTAREWLVLADKREAAGQVVPRMKGEDSEAPLLLPEPVLAVARYQADRRIARMDVVRLAENRGLPAALNAGIERCTGSWTMRMDSDDVCHPDRLRAQLNYLAAHPETDIVSSWTEEFSDGEEKTRLRFMPVRHDAVVQALRWRNIIVHPSILMRADLLRRVGGYSVAYPLLEDYDLWVRMAQAGARFHVIPAVRVRMRAGLQQSARRGGWRYCVNDLRFRASCLRSGFLSLRQFLVTALLYLAFRLAGTVLRSRLYGLARL